MVAVFVASGCIRYLLVDIAAVFVVVSWALLCLCIVVSFFGWLALVGVVVGVVAVFVM